MSVGAADVTVCVVAWNAARDLARCLDSLPAAARSRTLRAVVVDNGSEDDTARVLAQRADRVEVVRNGRNLGLTRGRNQALHLVEGGFVVTLDADAAPRAGAIDRMVEYLEANPRAGLVGPRLVGDDGSLQLSCRSGSPWLLPFLRRPPLQRWFEHSPTVDRHLMRDFDHRSARAVDYVVGACQCYRRELLPLLGSYDERIFFNGGEDADWCFRVWDAGFEVHYVPDAEVVHEHARMTREAPFSKQALRALTDFYYVRIKHREKRHGVAPR